MVARALGFRLGQMWNQPVIVENKPGAGGNIGAGIVAKAPADGYTLLLASPAEITINPHLYASMPFDPLKDLTAVTKVATAPLVLVANPSVPANTIGELVRYLKAQKNGTSYASSGTGGPQQLARDIAAVAGEKAFSENLVAQGAAPATMTPADFANFVKEESQKFSRLVKESGAKVD